MRSRGKVYWPCALLTTHVLIVDPVRFAPTSTPSIGPSPCELTTPVNAISALPSAIRRTTHVRANAAVTTRIPATCFLLIARLLTLRVTTDDGRTRDRPLCRGRVPALPRGPSRECRTDPSSWRGRRSSYRPRRA